MSPPPRVPATHLIFRCSAVIAIGAILLGCSDRTLPTAAQGRAAATARPDRAAIADATPNSAGAEQVALADLTRIVALALADTRTRQAVKRDMRQAPFTEHKLPFRSYLESTNGRLLLNMMETASGRSQGALLAQVATVRPLEFYMPVRSHRERWSGGRDVIVASQLGEADPMSAYDLGGQAVEVNSSVVPTTPTLALVPVETDFSRPLDSAEYTNVNDAGGSTIGTYVRVQQRATTGDVQLTSDCPAEPLGTNPDVVASSCDGVGGDPGTGGGDVVPPDLGTAPGGLYLTSMNVRNTGESFLRGAPELEVHIFGTLKGIYTPVQVSPMYDTWAAVFAPNATRLVWFDCAGEKAQGWRFFDFNSTGVNRQMNAVLFAQTENFAITETVTDPNRVLLNQRVARLGPPFEIRILERDDGEACPAPPKKFDVTFGFQLTVVPFNWGSIKPYDSSTLMEILNFFLGGGNDTVAQWTFQDFASLERFASTTLYGSGADLTVTNRGFRSYLIPPPRQIYPYP